MVLSVSLVSFVSFNTVSSLVLLSVPQHSPPAPHFETFEELFVRYDSRVRHVHFYQPFFFLYLHALTGNTRIFRVQQIEQLFTTFAYRGDSWRLKIVFESRCMPSYYSRSVIASAWAILYCIYVFTSPTYRDLAGTTCGLAHAGTHLYYNVYGFCPVSLFRWSSSGCITTTNNVFVSYFNSRFVVYIYIYIGTVGSDSAT